jgi:hypothetical protein
MTAPSDFNDSSNFKQAASDYLSTNRTRLPFRGVSLFRAPNPHASFAAAFKETDAAAPLCSASLPKLQLSGSFSQPLF